MAYRINTEQIIFTQLGNEGVIYSMETNEYVTLNETMFHILSGIDEGKQPGDIAAQLCREYTVSETDSRQAVTDALEQLATNGYIVAA